MASSMAFDRAHSLSEWSISCFRRAVEEAIATREGLAFIIARAFRMPDCSIPLIMAFLTSRSHFWIKDISLQALLRTGFQGMGCIGISSTLLFQAALSAHLSSLSQL